RARPEDRRVPDGSAQSCAVPDRAPQALRAAAGRARLRPHRVSAGRSLPSRRPQRGPRGQPGDPGDVLPGHDLVGGGGAARSRSRGDRDLGAERLVRDRRSRPPGGDGAGVEVARDAAGVARARRSLAPRARPRLGRRRAHDGRARPDAHRRPPSRARGRHVPGGRSGGGGGALRGGRSVTDPGPPPADEGAAEPRHLQSRQRLWVRSADSRFYRVELLNPGTDDMYGMTILEVDKEFRLTGRLDARRAHWTPAGWELSEGAYREIGTRGAVQTVPFVWTALDLKEEMEDFIRIQKPVSTMSYRELR